jgi:hypothetical protein
MPAGQHHSNQFSRITMKLGLAILGVLFLTRCSIFSTPDLPTPLPVDYLPTVIAQTLQSEAIQRPSATPSPIPPADTATSLPSPTATPAPDTPTTTPAGPTLSPTGPTSTPTRRTPSLTPTPTQEFPYAEIEIRNLGPLSKVRSPIFVFTYLKPGAGGKVRAELLGEDERILYRNVRVVNFVPVGAWATLTFDIDYEISAAAEAGRLVFSVDDEYGRTVALNSVPLILLSIGEADIVPPRDVLAPIILRQPRKKAVIQGGSVYVTGWARPNGDQPLLVRLLNSKGGEVGSRQATIGPPGEGGYGEFAVEVPYTVSQATTVLLSATIGGRAIDDVIHLVSREVILSP